LWDRKRSLLKISNQVAAREFARILLQGITARDEVAGLVPRRGIKSIRKKPAANTNMNGRRNGSEKNTISENSKRKRSRK
jgi:hypothetical protein